MDELGKKKNGEEKKARKYGRATLKKKNEEKFMYVSNRNRRKTRINRGETTLKHVLCFVDTLVAQSCYCGHL